ncbi:hypothetical protein [Streptomyces katrae]|uniref:Uncharacterized protein n=1 Tax=Streptomyces katrae TaxID=68223 RepID=A0A0F4IUQ5_9ACTN|nr:hypothetical protein [Streptomyces katrae]KJY25374.1 hypothetical protein VR44_32665 [Streptomyces katrae]
MSRPSTSSLLGQCPGVADPAWAAVRDLAREILFVLTGDRTLPMPEINVIPATSDTAAPLPVDHVAP